MIFISHTSVDKPIVEPIALKIANVFGKDKVFYDSWSIQVIVFKVIWLLWSGRMHY